MSLVSYNSDKKRSAEVKLKSETIAMLHAFSGRTDQDFLRKYLVDASMSRYSNSVGRVFTNAFSAYETGILKPNPWTAIMLAIDNGHLIVAEVNEIIKPYKRK